MKPISVVTRSFQAGAGINKSFDEESFNKEVVVPIRRLLTERVIGKVIVMVNVEPGNSLAEAYDPEKKETPTIVALKEAFPTEIASGRIIARPVFVWGKNPGSGIALNDGDDLVRQSGESYVLHWSPEIEMSGQSIAFALAFAEKYALSVVGFLRIRWWERPQWQMAQNTAAIWRLDALESVDGFARSCNGTGRTIPVEGFGDVQVAGMEDFHTKLQMLKANPQTFRWGMVGTSSPLHWNTKFSDPDRQRRHDSKVARQYHVMREYADEIFPKTSFEDVMDELFVRYSQGD